MINQVRINDYSDMDAVKDDAVIISEFAGRLCIEIIDGNTAAVDFGELQRAWNAVKKF